MALKSDFDGELLRITHDSQLRSNAFTSEDADDLNEILKLKKVRGLIWQSAHPTIFCSGGDLKTYAGLSKAQGILLNRKIAKGLYSLASAPFPKVAYVNGDCWGGGLELLSCFDYRACASHALFGFWQRRNALTFGWGGFQRWNSKVSSDQIVQLSLSARIFSAREALRIGIIHQIISDIKALSWLESAATLQRESGGATLKLRPQTEQKLFEQLWFSEEHRASLKKFISKRR